jgi:hypothetical protein
MLTGKTYAIILATGLFVSGCMLLGAKIETHKPDEAWWVSSEYKATRNTIYGIPVSEIDSEWKKVSILDMEYLKSRLSKYQYLKLQESDLVFSASRSFDGEPNMETFFVGVYESHSGQKGRFIAIKRASEILKYFIHPGFSGYSSIYMDDDQVHWYKCMECSDYDVIQWSGTDYILQ